MRLLCPCALVCIVAVLNTAPLWAAEPATVSGVLEGDRLLVKHGGTLEEVRLYGVDCPEAGQAEAEAAKDFTARKVLNQDVTLEERARDKENKPVVDVLLADGSNLGALLLESGLAWWDTNNTPTQAKYKGLNAKAIVGQVGIFKEAAPLAPWDYRKSHALPPVEYKAEAAPVVEEKKEEPMTLSAKGTGLYEEKVVDAGKIDFDKNLDYMSLVPKHNPRIATDANGNPIGLTADNIGDIPYAGQLGFQNGDIVSSINGNPVTDLSALMPLAQQLKGAKQLNVTVMRNGKPVPININIP